MPLAWETNIRLRKKNVSGRVQTPPTSRNRSAMLAGAKYCVRPTLLLPAHSNKRRMNYRYHAMLELVDRRGCVNDLVRKLGLLTIPANNDNLCLIT